MKLRVILVCTLLLLAAAPSFALDRCKECNQFNQCQIMEGAVSKCESGPGYCNRTTGLCSHSFAAAPVLTDWTVASIEISRPAQECIAVTTPAQVAEVSTATPHTTELK
ncbi:MAG TPA: hypothetical protein VEK57_24110 [Thermoanaerobaculia bacterium]|nr:hypothetical protein [Thermoanaerobaculia bacterium]